MVLEILYIGPDAGTCAQRREALTRLGHTVSAIDPAQGLPFRDILLKWSAKTGGLGLDFWISKYIISFIQGRQFDVVLIDGGELLGVALVEKLKDYAASVVNYNPDNPYTKRDGWKWRKFLKALDSYDLIVVPRVSSAEAAKRAGAKSVLRVNFAADEVFHEPIALSDSDRRIFGSDVAFVGTWMPERGPILAKLISMGVPLTIYGDRWERAAEYSTLKPYMRAVKTNGKNYCKALQGTKIAIGLLSKGNKDLHTTRSLEVPALGVLLCAERTSEHLGMYQEGKEAVFWSSVEECAALCLDLLKDTTRLQMVAAAGRRRALVNGNFNESLMSKIVTRAVECGRNGTILDRVEGNHV